VDSRIPALAKSISIRSFSLLTMSYKTSRCIYGVSDETGTAALWSCRVLALLVRLDTSYQMASNGDPYIAISDLFEYMLKPQPISYQKIFVLGAVFPITLLTVVVTIFLFLG
jgi:hypothetical protein